MKIEGKEYHTIWFENDVVRDALPGIVEGAKRYEQSLRKRYQDASDALKEEFTEEKYVSSRMRLFIKKKIKRGDKNICIWVFILEPVRSSLAGFGTSKHDNDTNVIPPPKSHIFRSLLPSSNNQPPPKVAMMNVTEPQSLISPYRNFRILAKWRMTLSMIGKTGW